MGKWLGERGTRGERGRHSQRTRLSVYLYVSRAGPDLPAAFAPQTRTSTARCKCSCPCFWLARRRRQPARPRLPCWPPCLRSSALPPSCACTSSSSTRASPYADTHAPGLYVCWCCTLAPEGVPQPVHCTYREAWGSTIVRTYRAPSAAHRHRVRLRATPAQSAGHPCHAPDWGRRRRRDPGAARPRADELTRRRRRRRRRVEGGRSHRALGRGCGELGARHRGEP